MSWFGSLYDWAMISLHNPYVSTGLVAAISAVIGYLLVNFTMSPILKYREIRRQIDVDLVYFANAYQVFGASKDPDEPFKERVSANRKAAAELRAIYRFLPRAYRGWIRMWGHKPLEASRRLIGLSNTNNLQDGFALIISAEKDIRQMLKLPKLIDG